MSRRRVLVVHTRMPAFDRDSGSQDIDNTVQFLLRAGWQVTFLAREEHAEERHARRLRQMGVATHSGFGTAERILRSGGFDLALIAFWEPAAELLPLIRKVSPDTRVIVNSMDIHFLRNARGSFSHRTALGGAFGTEATRELNTYNAADAVIAVSDKERDLLADFLGEGRVFTVPLAEDIERSPYPLEQRRGMYFVGNFRHLPNREAVEYLCAEVMPLLDPELLERHPLTVLGNWLDQVTLDIDPATPGVRLVGWVPSVQPYVERSRVAVVPLLHGAGVKRKVLQSMMAGTPVVTTPVGAEGLGLVQAEHALIAADAADLASGITRLLTDDDLWRHLVKAGADHVVQRHDIEVVERQFAGIIETVMSRRGRSVADGAERAPRFAGVDDEGLRHVIRRRIQMIGRPGEVVLVASGGDADLVDIGSHPGWPFPQGREGGWAGFDPVDGFAAVNHLEAQRARGARYFVLPKTAFSWRYRYPELFDHLETEYQRVHLDEHLAIYDLGGRAVEVTRLEPVPAARVRVVGTYAAHRTGPAPGLLTELGSSSTLRVEQHWRPDSTPDETGAAGDAEFVVYVRDDAILPSRFLDTLIATQVTLDIDRLQPTHIGGPGGGPPVAERHLGSVGREIDEVTSVPVLSVRASADREGRVVLADNVSVGLRDPLPMTAPGDAFVRRTWLTDADRRPVAYERPEPMTTPRISVLIATYDRPELLRQCLASFVAQTLDSSEYEVVVVDDGSENGDLALVLDEVRDRLQVVGMRIAHGGRSAAKNHAVFLARAPIVLFFDDDDRAAPDYLERHLAGHAAKPGEGVAVLGHTDWAPELEPTPLMHYITDVDRLMFAYERLGDGQELDWRGFWEGRISCKRSLLVRHGMHDQRLGYSIDVEMGWRLGPAGLRVIYASSARSLMARPIDFDAFCERTEAKGRAHAIIAALHPGTDMATRLQLDDAAKLWDEKRLTEPGLRRRVAALEVKSATDAGALDDLHAAYRETFRLLHAKGAAGATEGGPAISTNLPTTVQPFANTDPDLAYDRTPPGPAVDPLLSITIPVWSRTPELADMARRTIERIWEVARIPTEVVVVDNGSPFVTPALAAKVYRYPENKGVATGWNTGVRLSTAPVVVVMNSDCMVQPGWDVALYEAAVNGRRVAFPFTDHCDGLGFSSPDQGGTAGWCFMFARSLYEEVGVFDEWFNPAFCEDTDYWHRAWQMGIELTPVPAARVVHARRTTASTDARVDMLLQGHRYKYGWKHGVDPHRAPPYYNREIVDYVGAFRVPDPKRDPRPDRPRIFGIGLNKTGTTSLHEALSMLGRESLHWGGPAIRRLVEVSIEMGEPPLSRLDPRFDAFSDIRALSVNFALLDVQYPGSRFILTVRPIDEWLESRRRHVEWNVRRRAAGEYEGGFLTVEEEAWRAEWKQHVDGVRSYFAGRTDFLEIDLTARPLWEPLCELLDIRVPRGPFPWNNRRADEGRRES
jgi:GT2 family glycosyltransferase/glycosyltransferase involved in cell wall biosynthesis